MSIYIQSAAGVTPHPLYEGNTLLPQLVTHSGNRLKAAEPDYTGMIDAKLIRRMSRIIKMGVAAALQCLKEANLSVPDAITMGTAYGCLQDTEVFLTRLVEFKEELLTPTAFIQSTHNTVSAQVALMLQCHNYNNTYVHRGFSFESAITDAIIQLKEQEITNALVGGVDEITDASHAILSRFGLFKDAAATTGQLFEIRSKGTINGEGAVFFVLGNKVSDKCLAKLDAVSTSYKPENNTVIEAHITAFLSEHALSATDIDLLVVGRNGDSSSDDIYNNLLATMFKNTPAINFKQLCGEYPTASAYALWLAAAILKEGHIPAALLANTTAGKLQKILLYNHYQHMHHAFYLLSAC